MHGLHGFLDNYEVREIGAPVAAGSSIDANSDIIDMSDYESVTFVCPVTDSVQNGVATLKVEESDTNADGGMSAVSGAAATDTSAANDDLNDKLLAVEYRNPAKRYVQAVRTSSAANIAYGNVIAILKRRRVPVTAHSSVLASTAVSN